VNRASGLGHQFCDVPSRQPGQADPRGVPALPFGKQRLQRVAAVQVIGAVRDDEQHPGRADITGQERDQVPGRAVGPVQVLHHHRGRRHLAQAHEEVEHPLEYMAAGPWLRAGRSGKQRGQIVDPRARQHDEVAGNLNPIGRVFYSVSTLVCTPASLSQEVGTALGAQAGQGRLRDVVTAAGLTRFRRAAETPYNLVLEARP
jgi:hypothetical protein